MDREFKHMQIQEIRTHCDLYRNGPGCVVCPFHYNMICDGRTFEIGKFNEDMIIHFPEPKALKDVTISELLTSCGKRTCETCPAKNILCYGIKIDKDRPYIKIRPELPEPNQTIFI